MVRDTHSISIDRVQVPETDELLTLYIDLFHDREPLTKCIGFSRARMLSIARTMHTEALTNALSQGLCWIARDCAKTDRGVGFILCDDLAIADNERIPDDLTDQEREKISATMALLEELRSPVKDRIASSAGNCLYIAAIGVAPGYEGAGIAKALLNTALSDATDRGFLHAFSECTSIASRRCHEQAGFKSIHCVSVNRFAVNGVFPFASHDLDIHLMWKDLGEGKTC